jgi:hypothetical protein
MEVSRRQPFGFNSATRIPKLHQSDVFWSAQALNHITNWPNARILRAPRTFVMGMAASATLIARRHLRRSHTANFVGPHDKRRKTTI